jgi:hypothetical protein
MKKFFLPIALFAIVSLDGCAKAFTPKADPYQATIDRCIPGVFDRQQQTAGFWIYPYRKGGVSTGAPILQAWMLKY